VRSQVADIDTRLSSADESVRKLSENLEQVEKQQTTYKSRLTHPNLYAFNVIGYQSFARQLTMANAGRLAKHWGPLLGLSIPEKELFYIAHRICQIENVCLGRLATSIDAILLRSLVARAAGQPAVEVLEIGTLFGLGIIAMHEAIAPLFERVHFTALDPLEGYYGKEHRDVVTGVPVSRAVFDENLRRAGIPGDRVTVIQHLSTEAIAMEEARKTCYGLLVIDGDHRYAGVKHDLESYLGTVKPGGYVLVDDYGNPSWPDVKNYVDAEVLGRKDLELVGSDWHTAVFRVAGAH
jgi:predicted O-methyltransferase YrrM